MKHPDYPQLDWFTVGFAFAEDTQSVLLIEKKKSWCDGLWNGVGGAIEVSDGDGSTLSRQAACGMAREFYEETGLWIPWHGWQRFCTLIERKAIVYFYRTFVVHKFLEDARKTTDERVAIYHRSLASTLDSTMPNLPWLIPMAWNRSVIHAEVSERGGQYQGS